MFRLPATDEGFDLVKQMRKALNKDSYKMRTLYTGKRPHGHTPYTLKKDAESIRVYIDSKMPVPKPSDEEAMSLYMEGFNKGKAKIDALYKEVEEQAKRIDDSPSYNRLKVERDRLNKTLSAKDTVISNYQNDMDLRQREIDRLNTKVDDSPSYNRLKVENRELKKEIDRLDMKIDNEVCEGSCVSQEDYDEALELKDSMREELKALNKSSADFLRHKLAEALELLKEGSEEIKSLDKSKFSMRKEIIALNKSLAEAHASVSDLRDTVRDVREERDDALDINKDLRIRLESAKEEESITHIKHHYLGSIPEDDVLYWMKIGYLFYNKVEGNDVKSNG